MRRVSRGGRPLPAPFVYLMAPPGAKDWLLSLSPSPESEDDSCTAERRADSHCDQWRLVSGLGCAAYLVPRVGILFLRLVLWLVWWNVLAIVDGLACRPKVFVRSNLIAIAIEGLEDDHLPAFNGRAVNLKRHGNGIIRL